TAVTGTPTVTSTCGTAPTVTYHDDIDPASTPPCRVVIDRTWTATDTWGAVTECVQRITIVDTKPPVLTVNCPPAGTCYHSEADAIAYITSHSSGHDACCGDNVDIHVVRVTGAGTDCNPVFAVTAG